MKGIFIMSKLKSLFIAAIPIIGGGISGLLTSGSMEFYDTLTKPPLSPPGFLFPIVWSILYILMGISSLIIAKSDSPDKQNALTVFYTQLVFNLIWPLIFFCLNELLFAFVWLAFLWILTIANIIYFYKINKASALLLIPYLLWISFAGYLNLALYIIN